MSFQPIMLEANDTEEVSTRWRPSPQSRTVVAAAVLWVVCCTMSSRRRKPHGKIVGFYPAGTVLLGPSMMRCGLPRSSSIRQTADSTTRPYAWSGRTVAKILENKVYIGHTLNMRKTTISYKNKKQIQKPESEQILVENTHEPLISMEVWEIVQDVRAHKRRPPKHMEEPNLFSGLVYCADCGKYMVLCRTEKMREDQYYFRCYTYGKRGKTACSPHQIREADLKAIVLDDLRRVTHFARMKERQFAQYINQKNTAELRREINRLQRELDSMRRRYDELSALFKRLYEDNVLGRVSDEQFRMLSSDYNAEQKNLSASIPEKEKQLEKLKASAANVDAFIENAIVI